MKLSVRLAIVFGSLGLVTVASVSSLAYWLSANEVRDSVDAELTQRLGPFQTLAGGDGSSGTVRAGRVLLPPVGDDEPIGIRELLWRLSLAGSAAGGVASAGDGDLADTTTVVIDDDVRFEALGDTTQFRALFADGTFTAGPDGVPTTAALASLEAADLHLGSDEVDGTPYRVLTIPAPGSRAINSTGSELVGVQLLRDVTNEEQALDDLAVRLVALSAAGVAAVIAASWLVGRWMAGPIIRLTDTAAHLAELDDVPGRVEVGRNDELGQLAQSYNRLMSALEVGREQQRRLVADASHELRTPLTSLRMRLEYLERRNLDADRRQAMLRSAVADAEQLSALVSDLVDLAADVRSADEEPVATPLTALVEEVAAQARTATGRNIDVVADETTAEVRPTMVRRAVRNLVDNAVKYSPDGTITIRSHDVSIEVHDEGPGIAADDADHVFDRFFRSPKARSRPGNGIGLAIVKQVAEAHGGRTWVARRRPNGAIVGFSVAP